MGCKSNTVIWWVAVVAGVASFGAWLPAARGTDAPEPAVSGDSEHQLATAGDVQPAAFGGHVLTAERGGGILYAPSQPDDATFRAAVSDLCGGVTVDYFDARVATPDPALLSSYDCVFTWCNYSYADYMQFGENLADYVDGGGRVVLGLWTYLAFRGGKGGGTLPARIVEPGYCPVEGDYGSSAAYSGDGTTCLLDEVDAYFSTYLDVCTLREGNLQDGTYDDGTLAVGYRPDLGVIYVVGMCPAYPTGDFAQLLCNACSCNREGDVDDDGDVDLSDLAALLATYGLCIGEPGYNPGADFDASWCVDLADLAILLAAYES